MCHTTTRYSRRAVLEATSSHKTEKKAEVAYSFLTKTIDFCVRKMIRCNTKLGRGRGGATCLLWVLGVWCLLSSTMSPHDKKSNGGIFVSAQFLTPPGERRNQTYHFVEFNNSKVYQTFDGWLRYYCTFRGKWSKERHPNDFPRSPSYSAPVMISHSNGYRMWTGTETATLGVESIAEVRDV
jgi:Spondin_N